MPFIEAAEMAGQKRKRTVTSAHQEDGSLAQKRIKSLEAGIVESRANYNDIVELQQIAEDVSLPKVSVAAVVALCRVFCVLLAGGDMTKGKNTAHSEALLANWLREQHATYCDLLLRLLTLKDSGQMPQDALVKLVMRLVKEEATSSSHDHIWRNGLFPQFIRTLIAGHTTLQPALEIFTREYSNAFDDVRYYTFLAAASSNKEDGSTSSPVSTQHELPRVGRLELLLAIDPPTEMEQPNFLGRAPESKKHALYSLAKHKKQAQEAWFNTLRSEPSLNQRKEILLKLTDRIAPWFVQVDLLADFLTDSYNAGGATSLLALSGIYHLMKERNLDYPSFYVKLYSLLDGDLLHSKHRSRFFRHLEVFMSSSHLPAALVASFIKRLARLSLLAPPAGVIAVCPWIYNMLKAHPQCTFMIHRESHQHALTNQREEQGMDDPFDMLEADPMMTGAIDSSLWEIETLQSHYHPNVASLAKIISEQFTKQAYKMEDFLDYSYASIIDAELDKGLKKTPVTEWEIPKRIFTADDGGFSNLGALLLQVRRHT